MSRIILIVLFVNLSSFLCYAQNETQSYGKIDIKDLELKVCSFEKDANAMVLFDKGNIYYDERFDIMPVKIF